MIHDPLKESLDTLIEAEERLGLWERTLDGVGWWHVIRFDVRQRVLHLRGLQPRPGPSNARGLLVNVPRRPSEFLAFVQKNRWGDLRRADLLVARWQRSVRHGSRHIDPITDPLLETVNRTRLVLHIGRLPPRETLSGECREKALSAHLLGLSASSFFRRGFRLWSPDSAEMRDLRLLSVALARALGVDRDALNLARMAVPVVRKQAVFEPLFERLLDRTRPRAVLEVVHYEPKNIALTRVARRRGIPVVEVQHGLIGPSHVAYNFASGRRTTGFPDWLLTFGDWWRETTPRIPLPKNRVRAIGYAWLNQHIPPVGRPRRRPLRNVLFVSQPTLDTAFSRIAVQLAESTRREGVHVRFKPHPKEVDGWRERFPSLVDSNVEVVTDSRGLYEALKTTDAVVGVQSTALVEAAAFGIHVFIATLPGHEALAPFIRTGAATAISGHEDLARHLREPPSIQLDSINHVWARSSVERFSAFLDEVLGG